MKLQIKVKDLNISLNLINDNKIVDSLNWKDNRDLLENIIKKTDKLLQNNKIDIKELEAVESEINMDETYSTYRIIKSFEKTVNYCLES